MTDGRVLSWASSEDERDERIRHGERLVGLRLEAVRYFVIDYERSDRASAVLGPRPISDAAEWAAPHWCHQMGHNLDYGMELETESRRVFSIIWDLPGRFEGVGLREEPLIGHAFPRDAEVAVWDVGDRSRWQDHVGDVVSAIKLNYRPWDDSGAWWCDRVTIGIGESKVEVLLGEVNASNELVPSANNLVVVFGSAELPEWT